MKILRSTLLTTLLGFATISGANAEGVTVVNQSLHSGKGEFYFVEFQAYDDGTQPLTKHQIVVPDIGKPNLQGHGVMPEKLGNVRLYKATGSPDDMSSFERGQRVALCRDAEKEGSTSTKLEEDRGIAVFVNQDGGTFTCSYSE